MGDRQVIPRDKGEEYLRRHPRFNKWVKECRYCHYKGYDPDIPEQISASEGSLGSYFIKKYFNPLILDQSGLCEQCSKKLRK